MVDGETWFIELLRRPDYYLARGLHCLIVGAVGALPFNRKKIAANMKILASDGKAGFEVVALIKSFMVWARKLGATRFVFDARGDTDFGPVALRVGAKPYGPAYVVES